jgi:hypothetical protein
MANEYERFVADWKNRPQVGDPQAPWDPRLTQKPPFSDKFDPRLQRSSETNVPTQPFQGEGPKPQPPRELPPGAQPAPPLPGPKR